MRFTVSVDETDAGKPARAFTDRHEVIEELEVSDKYAGVMGDEVAPLGTVSPDAFAGFHQFEILGIPVGADHPTRVEVVRRVFEVTLALREYAKLARRRGLGTAQLVRYGAAETDADVLLRTRGAQTHIETVIQFLVDDRVAAGLAAERVRFDPSRQERVRVVHNVKQRPVVGGPGKTRRNPGNLNRQRFMVPEILDSQCELPAPDRVFNIGQEGLIRAELPVADLIEVVSVCQLVDIEHDLFRRVHVAFAAGVDRVLLTDFEARVVPVILVLVRYGAVVLLDSPDQFLVQGGFGSGQRRHDRIGIVILGLEVRQHVGVGAFIVAQPIVFVLSRGPVRRRNFVRTRLNDGRRYRRRTGIEPRRDRESWVGGVDRCISCWSVTLPASGEQEKRQGQRNAAAGVDPCVT